MQHSDANSSAAKIGAVVPLTLGILLSVTLLLTALLQVRGTLRRVALRSEQTLQQVYEYDLVTQPGASYLVKGEK
jgi:hypothetical protein